jgi:hypothetical protein
MARRGPTAAEKLLLAAYDLDQGSNASFTAEDLVVAAWKRYPRVFGLRGHDDGNGLPLYPDSNRVFAEIMGSKPIRKRGYLVKVGEKRYGLTETGRQAAEQMAAHDSTAGGATSVTTGRKATMSREVRAKLERLLKSTAVLRAQAGELDRITFHDACVFWGITSRTTAIELEGSFANIESVVATAEKSIRTGASELRTGGNDLSSSTTDLLRRIHGLLMEKFADELSTIIKRTDQRKQYA